MSGTVLGAKETGMSRRDMIPDLTDLLLTFHLESMKPRYLK